ncbi:MAG: ABC transporter permease [Candidatus Pelethousia sp.]|nr:ABC transporter permease [Candidatus Pelethousia sp.]
MDILASLGTYMNTDIRLASPILLAGLGLLIINRSGLLNIGAEGIMLISTLMAVAGSYYSGSVWVGLLAAMVSGMALGLIFAFLTVTLKANQVVVGAAINVLGSGLSATLFRIIFGVSASVPLIDVFAEWKIPILSKIPVMGTAFFSHMPIVYIAFLMAPLLSFFLFRTQAGLNLRSVGENPKAADTLGINVYRTQYMAAIIGSMIVAMGGSVMSTGLTKFFSEEMVSGRGYIALAAVVFGRYKPSGVMAAAMIFMAGSVLSNILQVSAINIPFHFLIMLPYLLTIAVLAAFAGNSVAPASLGKPYKRG